VNADSSGSARRVETVREDAVTLPAGGDEVPEPGARIGRYLLLERLGMGGMGVVFAAFDPDLDRRVALKLLRGHARDDEADQRLLREARALAKLTHPNVVPVFDVGTAGGRTYVAMECVEGQTLGRWLAAQSRTHAEILRVFGDVARGLAAAHAIGIVHRDVKPDNVLLGTDGRARIGDFGLARPVLTSMNGTSTEDRGLASAAEDSLNPGAERRGMDPARLTRAGLVLGTPAYMAPEQHRGGAIGPATDQFALCVALYEALFGTRPFVAPSVRELVRHKLEGRLVPPPVDREVPPRMRAAIVRGLAPSPEDRWPDLASLFAALERDPRRRRTTVAALAAGTIAIAAAIAWPVGASPCDDDTRVDAVWNPTRSDEVHAAFVGTGLGYAEASWTRTRALVNAYAEAWKELHHDTCVAATTEPRMPAADVDRRSRCLDDRLAALDDLVGVLADADSAMLQHAVTTAASLPAVADCLDSRADAIERDPTRAAERQAIGRGLTRVVVLEHAGRYHGARGEAEMLLARAERLGDARMLAATHQQLGSALQRTGEYDAAREHLKEGVFAATEANDDIIVANAALDLVWLEGVDHSNDDAALEWARHASAAIERSDNAQGRAQLANALGAVDSSRGRNADALAQFERAKEIFAALGEETASDLGTAHQNIGIALGAEGRHAEALQHLEKALAISEDFHGPDHPETANTLDAIAGELMHLGELGEARTRFERALAVRTAALPERHPDLARSHNNLGSLLDALGDLAGAEDHFRRALVVFEASLGATHPYYGAALANLANVQYRRGDHDVAARALERALDILAAELPADHAFVLQTSAWLARSEATLGDLDGARGHAATVLGACETGGGDPTMCGHARFARARVEAAAGDREHARAMAEQARDELRSAGDVARPDVTAIDRWLAAQ
jgi:eukaryotic-like serine/threonine-protein kinase